MSRTIALYATRTPAVGGSYVNVPIFTTGGTVKVRAVDITDQEGDPLIAADNFTLPGETLLNTIEID